MENNGRKIHKQAEKAREDGEFLKSLQLLDEATIEYQKVKDDLGLAETQSSRSLVFRHLFKDTKDRNYLVLAKNAANSGVEIAGESSDITSLAIPLFNLAKVQEDLGDLQDALNLYQEAIFEMQQNPPEIHNRKSVLLDMQLHLSLIEAKNGDKTALERAEQFIEELKNADEEKYNIDVWVSGGYMKMAEVLKEDNPQMAKEYFQKAKEIIDANPDLKLRKKQLED